ncbi:hypothetical protein DPMN_179197 [Dreissena polymorpha]|uniref:Uncharacterized protein n=1 Tax=Dreissena polymorpha TaxID=45954 RepID=A0A9D4EEP3_DREPO|nr:hypothetical protein DPMN_179197 [Dreissena polymorpha]
MRRTINLIASLTAQTLRAPSYVDTVASAPRTEGLETVADDQRALLVRLRCTNLVHAGLIDERRVHL